MHRSYVPRVLQLRVVGLFATAHSAERRMRMIQSKQRTDSLNAEAFSNKLGSRLGLVDSGFRMLHRTEHRAGEHKTHKASLRKHANLQV